MTGVMRSHVLLNPRKGNGTMGKMKDLLIETSDDWVERGKKIQELGGLITLYGELLMFNYGAGGEAEKVLDAVGDIERQIAGIRKQIKRAKRTAEAIKPLTGHDG